MDTRFSNADPELDGAVQKAIRRLVPFLLLMYVLAFLDRANVGFAEQAFKIDTGLSHAAYAFGAGIFFVGYSLFEVPSNLFMHRVGARLWMCRIMVTWGLVSAGMVFVQGDISFYTLRFVLGIAEAGFFPGVIYYLAQWFPTSARTRAIGYFYLGAPLAFIIGSPLSGLLLEMHGTGGMRGWQWMFLIEGLLASIVGVWAFWYLDNRPEDARWLTPAQRVALGKAMLAEDRHKIAHGPQDLLGALTNARVLFLSAIYFLIQMSVYGVVFFLPSQVAALVGEQVGIEVGLVTSIPWICALIAVCVVPQWAKQGGSTALIAAVTLAVSAGGIALSVASSSPLLSLIALCLAAAGFIAVQPLFWSFPTAYLGGVAAAGGIALINSLGSLGGFFAPNAKAFTEQALASSQAGLYVLAGTTMLGAGLFVGLRDRPARAAAT
jgi:MFS family permease